MENQSFEQEEELPEAVGRGLPGWLRGCGAVGFGCGDYPLGDVVEVDVGEFEGLG